MKAKRKITHELQVYLVFVSTFDLNDSMHACMHQDFARVCSKAGAVLTNMRCGKRWVELEVRFPPQLALSKLINTLKGVSSRMLRARAGVDIPQAVWTPSYYAGHKEGAEAYIKVLEAGDDKGQAH